MSVAVNLGAGVFYNADLWDVFEVLRDGSVDFVFADLPYGTTRNKWDSPIDLTRFWSEVWRVCTPNAAVVATAQVPFSMALGYSQLPFLRYEWVWEKTSATGHLNAKKQPMKAHENVLVFYRKQPVYNPIMSHGHARKTSKSHGARDLSTNYGYQSGVKEYDSTSRYPRSVQTFSSDKQTQALHPTQKPVALVQYLIETYTNAGATCLDVTAGSGTTAVAAEACGRNWICVEKETSYFEVAVSRLRAVIDVL